MKKDKIIYVNFKKHKKKNEKFYIRFIEKIKSIFHLSKNKSKLNNLIKYNKNIS
ncbi:hypothetical protein CLOACE_16710 [Clostridium acetireducens DSM 10703]|jgi:hypothetical protein|uniref:Uncharacterized protein n=1 Tax=Clostridium acetireducens DSM 10703 TaxID=1121290 RepID=A0A1E8EXK1_9CLOT|nr:hypothetical protein [Clostridium acetireducens]OFI05513.1 hypothetical protein CLOACE_16710 [Clostridium acetireducens DSM 10703]